MNFSLRVLNRIIRISEAMESLAASAGVERRLANDRRGSMGFVVIYGVTAWHVRLIIICVIM